MSSFNSIDDFDFTEIVNKHSDEMKHRSLEETYESAYERSTSNKEIKMGKKKIGLREAANIAITAIAIFATLFTAGRIAVERIPRLFGTKPAISHTVSDEIDDKIDYYYKMMNHTGDFERQIERAYSYNGKTKEANVDYLPGNFIKNVVEASDKGEIEVRCVLLAAFKIINDPYIEEQFDFMLKHVSSDEEYKEAVANCPILRASSWEELLEILGYKNTEDYNDNERYNIKALFTEIQAINNARGVDVNERKRI